MTTTNTNIESTELIAAMNRSISSMIRLNGKIRAITEELESESRWAQHYLDKLVEARKLGYLPDDFEF